MLKLLNISWIRYSVSDFLEFYKTNKILFALKLTVINILSDINRKQYIISFPGNPGQTWASAVLTQQCLVPNNTLWSFDFHIGHAAEREDANFVTKIDNMWRYTYQGYKCIF